MNLKYQSPSFCFVLLHYLDKKTTIECITSIEKSFQKDRYSVVIVDNGSPNGTGVDLENYYREKNNIKVIISDKNLGFANGNNLGYFYAKKELKADYIIMANNDIIFQNSNFLKNIERIFKETNAFLIGPDIITPSGLHQSPLRDPMYDKKMVRRKIFIKTIFLIYFKIKKLLRLENRINILEEMFDKRDKVTQDNRNWQEKKYGVVLQGACIVYTSAYLAREEKAFFPDTFMYGEEDLLSYYCAAKGYSVLYTPEIQVLHLNGETTKKVYGNTLEKSIFNYTYYLKGLKILYKKMKTDSRNLKM